MTKLSSTLLVSIAMLSLTGAAMAQEAPSATTSTTQEAAGKPHVNHAAKRAELKQKMESMTPEERATFKAEHKEKLKERYDNATPEQQAKMKERYEAHKAHRAEAKGNAAPTEGEAAK